MHARSVLASCGGADGLGREIRDRSGQMNDVANL